jgi:hypothetical protein
MDLWASPMAVICVLETYSALHTCLFLSCIVDWNASRKLSAGLTWKLLHFWAISLSNQGYSECIGSCNYQSGSLFFYLCIKTKIHFLFWPLRQGGIKKNIPCLSSTFTFLLCPHLSFLAVPCEGGSHRPEPPIWRPLTLFSKAERRHQWQEWNAFSYSNFWSISNVELLTLSSLTYLYFKSIFRKPCLV